MLALAIVGLIVPAAAGTSVAGPAVEAAPVTTSGVTPADLGSSLAVTGRGFGHGYGMSQWGAYGYAVDRGWSWTQILDHYYAGTVAGTVDPESEVTVRLEALDGAQTAVVHDTGKLTTTADPEDRTWRAVVARHVGGSYRVWGRSDVTACPSASADLDDPASGWVLLSAAAGDDVRFRPPSGATTGADLGELLAVCRPDGSVGSYRGELRALRTSDGLRTVNALPVEQYLRSVISKEMSPSWGDDGGWRGMNALRAQAVAARSYALSERRTSWAMLCDSQSCQVYAGAASRPSLGAAMTSNEYATTDEAVVDTRGVVRRTTGGALVVTMYAASSGGWTDQGAGLAYRAVEDLGDATSRNPYHRWTTTLAITSVESRYPSLGRLVDVDVTSRNGLGEWGGRVRSMVLRGSAGNVTLTGDQFRRAFSLRSNWFDVAGSCDGRVAPPIVDGSPPAAGAFTAVGPVRVLDTRIGLGTTARPVGGDCTVPLQVAGAGAVPAGATAVVANLTATNSVGPGYVTAYACGRARPLASSLNPVPGRAVANLVTVPVGTDGRICLYTLGRTDLVLDVLGWYGPGGTGRYQALVPARLVDTRDGTGGRRGRLAPDEVAPVVVPGRGGVPSTGVTAVALNVTVVEPTGPGWLRAFACGGPVPSSSNVNYVGGQTVPNHVVVPIGTGGAICLQSMTSTHVVVDVQGWYGPSGSSLVQPVGPARLLDTRSGLGARAGLVGSDGSISVLVAGREGVAADARAVALNVTVAGALSSGYVTVWPCGATRPWASHLNHVAGQIVANHVVVPIGDGGRVCLYAAGRTHLVADVLAYVR